MQSSSKPLIYLASASPRRSALLTQIGVSHEVRPVDVDETIRPGEGPGQYVQRLARSKAAALWSALPSHERRAVLGADTTVAVEGHILGKPSNEADCLRMLRLLSDRTHQVYTALSLHHAAGDETVLNVSDVSFRALDEAEMRAYWASGEPADKAGGYAVQGRAALFIDRIAGSYSGIMGLPLYDTGRLLEAIGWRHGAERAGAGA
jgi:nucleoside triphosphate pyrophosphatase